MKTIAPAKINWTLEVLARRDDGYNEIRSVMQTIGLCDELWAERAPSSTFETDDGAALSNDDLVVVAARALEERVGEKLPARIQVQKRIPLASGLGGGSSDAGAVLRLLNEVYGLRLTEPELSEVGASIGSDVPFFIYGGTALVEGRGERVTPLRDIGQAWLTIVVPTTEIPNKTRTMYRRLTTTDYTDGSHTNRVCAAVSGGAGVNGEDTFNVFDRHVYDLVEQLRDLSNGLFKEGLFPVHVVGAGPAIFVYCDNPGRAESLATYADRFAGRMAKTFVVRTLSRREATSLSDAPAGLPR